VFCSILAGLKSLVCIGYFAAKAILKAGCKTVKNRMSCGLEMPEGHAGKRGWKAWQTDKNFVEPFSGWVL